MSAFAASAVARPPLPEGPLFEAEVASCREVLARDGCPVRVDAEAAAAWAAGAELEAVRAPSDRFTFPLRFGDQREEINFRAALHLVLAASGFDGPLAEAKGRGSALAVSFGVMGMHLGGAIDAETMVGMTLHQASQLFDVPVDHDVEVSPAVYQSRPHPLRPVAEKIRRLFNETGAALRGLGAKDMADLVYDAVARAERGGGAATAEALVRHLASRVAGFDDRAGGALLLSKAQLLAADLGRRFAETDPRFDYADRGALGVGAGSRLAAVVRALGLVRVTSPGLEAALARGKDLAPGSDEEVALRAAAVVACDEALRALRAREGGADLAPSDLDDYFCGLAGDKGEDDGDAAVRAALAGPHRPHVCRDTAHY